MTSHSVRSNIRKYYAFQALNSLAFFSPVIVLFWQSKGLSMTQIFTLQSVFSLGALLLEIPTGAFADHFGKKPSMVIGSLFLSFGLFWYGVSQVFWQFALGELLCAAGMAFISGADRAFIHQTLRSLQRDHEYSKTEGNVRALNQFAQAIGNVVGGFLGSISLGITLISTGFATLMAFFVGLTFSQTTIQLPREEKTDYLQTIRSSLRILRHDRYVLWVTLFFAAINSTVFASNWFSQPYLQMLNIPVLYFGIIFTGFSLFAAFCSMHTDRFSRAFGDKAFLTIGIIAVSATFILGVFPSVFTFPLFALFIAIVTVTQTLVSQRTLSRVPQATSATILSFQNLLRRSVYAAFLPILGIISDRFGASVALQSNALLLSLLLLLLFLFPIKKDAS